MSAKLFKFIRMSKNLTQEGFAREIGVSRALVSLIELGAKPVSTATRRRVARAVGEEYVNQCRAFIERGGE